MTGDRFSVRNMIYNNALMVFILYCIIDLLEGNKEQRKMNSQWLVNAGWMLGEWVMCSAIIWKQNLWWFDYIWLAGKSPYQ